MSKALEKLRLHSPYEEYQIISILKPYALSDEILKSLQLFNITSDDRVLLCVGEHDRNPMRVIIELSATLKSFTVCPIVIMSVVINNFLNVSKLNAKIRLIADYFDNVHFVQCENNYVSRKANAWEFYDKINRCLDQLDYDSKYLKYNLRKHIKMNVDTKISKNSQCSIVQKYPKGTIPYYFGIVKKRQPSHNNQVIQSCSMNSNSKTVNDYPATCTNASKVTNDFFRI